MINHLTSLFHNPEAAPARYDLFVLDESTPTYTAPSGLRITVVIGCDANDVGRGTLFTFGSHNLQCLDAIFGVNWYEKWTPERNAIGHPYVRLKRTCV
jgi:hypothetical protein